MKSTFMQTSVIALSPEQVWQRVTQAEGINDELYPLLRMTTPKLLCGKRIEDVPLGISLGKSWLLLFCLVPVDFDAITLVVCTPGQDFCEESHTRGLRLWSHKRRLRRVAGGCEVSDELTYALRFPWRPAHWCIGKLLRYLFAHRHRRLARWSRQLNGGR
jgi:ligand-binding SRPBCC domain-containing protein